MKSIYLDYNSTSPVDARVLEAMLPLFSEQFGNAGSATHFYGRQAAEAVEAARVSTASLFNCDASEIVFTSGATEAVNLAMRGVMQSYAGSGNHFIIASTEHKAVLDTAIALENASFNCTRIGVSRDGRIDLTELQNAVRAETVLVCIMMANNETGVLQDVDAVGSFCKERNILFFSDTTQAAGRVMVNVKDSNMSMACISAHKIYGPKGVGALYVSRKSPRVQLLAQITGGGQERGFRSGTLNVPGIAGLGKACELAALNGWDDNAGISALRTVLEQRLEMECGAKINGSIRYRLPNTTSLRIPGIKASRLITQVPQLAFSTGSACTSALPEPSHVLTAMGLNESETSECIRLSLGKYTTEEDVNAAVGYLSEAVKVLRGRHQ